MLCSLVTVFITAILAFSVVGHPVSPRPETCQGHCPIEDLEASRGPGRSWARFLLPCQAAAWGRGSFRKLALGGYCERMSLASLGVVGRLRRYIYWTAEKPDTTVSPGDGLVTFTRRCLHGNISVSLGINFTIQTGVVGSKAQAAAGWDRILIYLDLLSWDQESQCLAVERGVMRRESARNGLQ